MTRATKPTAGPIVREITSLILDAEEDGFSELTIYSDRSAFNRGYAAAHNAQHDLSVCHRMGRRAQEAERAAEARYYTVESVSYFAPYGYSFAESAAE